MEYFNYMFYLKENFQIDIFGRKKINMLYIFIVSNMAAVDFLFGNKSLYLIIKKSPKIRELYDFDKIL